MVVPNDNSTIRTGVGGIPRYIGEQKFILVNFNVTAIAGYTVDGIFYNGGLNSILVPRGLFFDSRFYRLLNDTSPTTGTNMSGTVLARGNAVIYGTNKNNVTNPNATLNNQTVQMFVNLNVSTVTDIRELINLLTWNATNNTAYVMNITNRFVTLGLVKSIYEVVPNRFLRNDGSYPVPAPRVPTPPQPWYAGIVAAWNSFVGWISSGVTAVWNAAMGAWNYLANAARAIVNFVAGLARYMLTGDATALRAAIQEIQDKVIKPFVDAINAMRNWIKANVRQMSLTPLRNLYYSNGDSLILISVTIQLIGIIMSYLPFLHLVTPYGFGEALYESMMNIAFKQTILVIDMVMIIDVILIIISVLISGTPYAVSIVIFMTLLLAFGLFFTTYIHWRDP